MEYVWLCLSAAGAGVINSLAGGGTLLTFPALVWVLGGTAEATVLANATSTVALFPGSLAGTWGYRRELAGLGRWIRLLMGPSLIGGMLGALLVIWLPAEWFRQLIPWLILTATVLFLMQPTIARWTGIGQPHAEPTRVTVLGIVGFQFLVSVYGGYFGAGIGILMLSSLALIGVPDIHQMNALKTLFASAINGLAVAVFLMNGKIEWQYAWPMIGASIIGGFGGAVLAKRLNRNVVRATVIAMGFILATYYFAKISLGE